MKSFSSNKGQRCSFTERFFYRSMKSVQWSTPLGLLNAERGHAFAFVNRIWFFVVLQLLTNGRTRCDWNTFKTINWCQLKLCSKLVLVEWPGLGCLGPLTSWYRDHIPVLFYDFFFCLLFLFCFYKGAEEEKVYKRDDCTPGIRLLLQSDCGTTGRSAKTMQTKCSVNVQQREDVKTIKKD